MKFQTFTVTYTCSKQTEKIYVYDHGAITFSSIICRFIQIL